MRRAEYPRQIHSALEPDLTKTFKGRGSEFLISAMTAPSVVTRKTVSSIYETFSSV